jgi:cation diffusion facilitator family transporter
MQDSPADGHAHGHSHTTGGSFAGATRDGLRALAIGVAGLAITTVLQALLLLFSGSVALLGDTLHNGVDLVGTAVVWVAFRLASRERNERYTFGYHRYEDLAGLFVVVLIIGSAGLVLYESVMAFSGDVEASHPWVVFAAGLIGALGNEAVAQFKIRTGERIGSPALVADGRHSRADGLSSLGVVAAAIGLMAGADWLDAIAGLGIGILIAWAGLQSAREVLGRLLDRAEPGIRTELEQSARDVRGIEHVNDMRIRQAGRTVHVVANVCVDASLSVATAHEFVEELRMAWLHVLPDGSEVDIHVDPFTPGIPAPHLI